MSKVMLLKKAADVVQTFLTNASSSQTLRASARIGADISKRGVPAVVSTVKENPVTAALLLYEAGALGKELLTELMAEDENVAQVVEVLEKSKVDDIQEDDVLADVSKFKDEFQAISDATAILGGWTRFLELRKALMVSDEVLMLYLRARDLTKIVR